jgi:subtilisin family serine protease
MATPHVAGAAATIWSTDPNMLARDVAKKLMDLSTATDAVNGKVVSNGRLDLHGLK